MVTKVNTSQFKSGILSQDLDIQLQDATSYFAVNYSGGAPALYVQDNTVDSVALSSKSNTESVVVNDNGVDIYNASGLALSFISDGIRFYDTDSSNYAFIKAPGTLAGNYTLTLPADDGTPDQVLKTDGSGNLSWVTQTSGVTDHGALTGLSDDDHTQYALLAGRGSNQTLNGGTTAGGGLILDSTSNATKGSILLNPSGGDVHIGGGTVRSYLYLYEDSGSGGNKIGLRAPTGMSADYSLTLPTTDGLIGQVLTTDGSGNLTWEDAVSGSSSSGSAGAVQISNGSGGFTAEEANFFYTTATNQVLIANGTGYNLQINSDNGGIQISPVTSGLTGALNAINVTGSATGNLNIGVTNSNAGSGANSRLSLNTASGAGDPFVLFSVGDTSYIAGIDNSDSDTFRIGIGSNPSTMTSNSINIRGNKVGVSGQTAPTAALHLPAGTASAETAPLKFTTGTAMTTPEDGALEYHGSHLYFTIGSTRYQLDQQAASISDGDKGDITVSGSGATWTIDNLAVTNAKINDVSAAKFTSGNLGANFTMNAFAGANIGLRYSTGATAFQVGDGTGQASVVSPDGNHSVVVTNTSVSILDGTNTWEYVGGVMRLYDSDSTNWIGFTTPATGSLTANYTLTFPANAGSNGQALTTNGSGTLSWTTVGTGDVVGPASSVNNRVVTFDGTTGKLIKDSGYGLPSGSFVGTTDTQTLTNKRIDLRVSSAAYTATLQPDPSTWDIYYMTGATGTITLGTFTGTPVQGNRCTIALKDNNTSRTISWNSNYKAMGVSLPTSTVAGKWLYINVIYFDASNYHVVGISSEA